MSVLIVDDHYQKGEDVRITPKVYSDYLINVSKTGIINLMNDIYENCIVFTIDVTYSD